MSEATGSGDGSWHNPFDPDSDPEANSSDPGSGSGEPLSSFDPNSLFRCWCCASLLMLNGDCPICDSAGMMSPPHVCRRSNRVISDEHGCDPEFTPLASDYETEHRHGGTPGEDPSPPAAI